MPAFCDGDRTWRGRFSPDEVLSVGETQEHPQERVLTPVAPAMAARVMGQG